MRRRAALFVALALWGLASTAQAQEIHLDLEASTDVPVALGVTAGLELPLGLRASSSLGTLPRGYVSLINAVVQSFPNTYNQATGDLIEQTLQSSLVWRSHVGWATSLGLYFDAGYGLVALGGGTSTEALLAAVTGQQAPGQGGASQDYAITSTLHMLDLEVGWKGELGEGFTLRAGLGLAGTLAASSSVDAEFTPARPAGQRLVKEFEAYAEGYLVDTYTSYVFTPVISLGLGYRLF